MADLGRERHVGQVGPDELDRLGGIIVANGQ